MSLVEIYRVCVCVYINLLEEKKNSQRLTLFLSSEGLGRPAPAQARTGHRLPPDRDRGVRSRVR